MTSTMKVELGPRSRQPVIAHSGTAGTITLVMADGGGLVLLKPGDERRVWLGRDGRFYRLTRWRRVLSRLGLERWLP